MLLYLFVMFFSAGIGRTGTFIGIDSLFKQGEASYYLGINQYVREMRQNRVNMVQTLVSTVHYIIRYGPGWLNELGSWIT